MAAKWNSGASHVPVTGIRGKKTSQGRKNLATSTMNKNYKR